MRPVQRQILALVALLGLSLLSCGREVTGPGNGFEYGRSRTAALALDPQMPSLLSSLVGAGSVVPFEKVRVVLRREDNTIALDTLIDFPASVDTVALTVVVPIPINAPEDGLPLALTMAYINAAGDTVFSGGPVAVIARPVGSSGSETPITIPVTYEGPGADAASVLITPNTDTVYAGTSSSFTAVARDATTATITGAPLLFYTLDSSRASVPAVGAGNVNWLPVRGIARIVAALPDGQPSDTAYVLVELPASKLVLGSGGAQSGTFGVPLAQPIVVRTLASDDVPVPGVVVTFAIATGGGSLTTLTDTSDANGEVSTQWTLGATIGAQTITATAAGLTFSPLTIGATATAGVPARVVISAAPTAGTAGQTLAPALVASVQDIAGNTVTTFTGAVSVALSAGSSATLGGTVGVNAVAGIATFSTLSLDLSGAWDLVVTSGALQPDTAQVSITAAAPAALAFIVGPTDVVAGDSIIPPVRVEVRDLFGNLASTPPTSVSVALSGGTAGAVLGGTLTVLTVGGVAEFTGLNVDKSGTGYVLNATAAGLSGATSVSFAVSAAAAVAVAQVAGDLQTATVGTLLPDSLAVVVSDIFGNPIAGHPVTWVVTSGQGTVSPSNTTTNAQGRAAAAWTLGDSVGEQTVSAGAGPAGVVVFSATATAGAPSQLAITSGIAVGQIAGTSVGTFVIGAEDALGNPTPDFADSVHVTILSGPVGGTVIAGAQAALAAAGTATFAGLTFDKVGAYVLEFTAAGLTSVVSDTFVVAAATASVIVMAESASGDGQNGAMNTGLPLPLRVYVRDLYGNPVAGVSVAWSVASGTAFIGVTPVLTDATGLSQTTIVLGGTAGAVTIHATAPVASGSPVVFSATVNEPPLQTLAVIQTPGPTVAGTTIAAQPYLVEARDIGGNVIPEFTDSVTLIVVSGPGAASGTTTVAAVAGIATFADVSFTVAGVYGIGFTTPALADTTLAGGVTIVAAAPDTILLLDGDAQTVQNGGALLVPMRVRVVDAFGNPVGGVLISWTLLSGAGTLNGSTSLTDVGGVAFMDGTLGSPVGPRTVRATTAVLPGQLVDFTIEVTAGAPVLFTIESGNNQTGVVFTPFADSLVVRVRDVDGNPVPNHPVHWALAAGAGVIADTLTLTDAAGYATNFATYSGAIGVNSAVTATTDLLGTLLTFEVIVLPDVAASLDFTTQPADATAGELLPNFTVTARDQYGNVATGWNDSVRVVIDSGPVGAVLTGSSTRESTAGLTTFPDLTLDKAGIYRLRAEWTGLTSAVSGTLEIFPSSPDSIALVDGNGQNGVVLSTLAAPLRVRVLDSLGNGVPGVNVNWGVFSGIAEFSDTVAVSDALGFAVTNVTLGPTIGPVVLQAAAAGLVGSPITFNATATPAAATQLTVETEPVDGSAGTFLSSYSVAARDAQGNIDVNFTGLITVAVDSGPAGAILQGVASVAAVAGIASFDSTYLELAGDHRLRFTASGLADTLSAIFNIVAGAATTLSLVDGDVQADTVDATFALPFRVLVTDAFGNPVAGHGIAWVLTSGVISIDDDSSVTGADGIAVMQAHASNQIGPMSVEARAAGLTGTPVVFNFDVLPGAATILVLVAAPDTVASGAVSPSFEIEARDRHGNLTPAYADSVTVSVNDGPDGNFASGTTARLTGAGSTAFDDLVFGSTGSWTLEFSATGLTSALAFVEVIAGAPVNFFLVSGDNQTGMATTALDSALVVAVQDGQGNAIAGDTVEFLIVTGGGVLGNGQVRDTVVTDANGRASTTWTLGSALGAQTVEAHRAGFPAVGFTATSDPMVANRVWSGDVSTSIGDAANWKNNVLPTATDSILIPAGRPNYPVLTSNILVERLTIEAGGSLDLDEFVLFVDGSVVAPATPAITADTGAVALTNAAGGSVSGAFPRLIVQNGPYLVNGALAVATDLILSDNAGLDVATHAVTVGRDFYTNAGARLEMNAGADVTVERHAFFVGGSTAGYLTGGTLRVRGNFLASGSDPQAFSAAAGHTVVLDGPALQAVQLTFPDTSYSTTCSASCFGTLLAPKGAGDGAVAFVSSAKAVGHVAFEGDTTLALPFTLISAGEARFEASATIASRIGWQQGLVRSGTFIADTLVAWGTDTTLIASESIPTIVIGTSRINAAHTASVVVEGVLDVEGPASIGGSLITRGSGHVTMSDPADSLHVAGDATFGGSGATPWSAGALSVGGALSQTNFGSTSFIADSAHRLWMTGESGDITIVDPTNNPLGSLYVGGSATAQIMQPGAVFRGDVTLLGPTANVSDDGVNNYSVFVDGRLTDSVGGQWQVPFTILRGVDPLVTKAFTGHLMFENSVTLTDTLLIAGNLWIGGALGHLTIGGQFVSAYALTTTGSGRLTMNSPADSLVIQGDIVFGGGPSLLSDGLFEFYGNLSQATTADAVQGAPEHVTRWVTPLGAGVKTLSFANPGYGPGTSHLGTLEVGYFASATGIGLASDLFVNGALIDESGMLHLFSGSGQHLVSRGANVGMIEFSNVSWQIVDGAPVDNLSAIVFGSTSSPDSVQFRIARPNGTISINDLEFQTLPTTGKYLQVEDTDGGDSQDLTVNITNVTPAVHGGNLEVIGTAVVTGWDIGGLNWNGSVSSDWANAANWDEGRAPLAVDSVYIPAVAANSPIITAPSTVRAIVSIHSTYLEVEAALTVTERISVPQTNGITCDVGGTLAFGGIAAKSVAGSVACDVTIDSAEVVAADDVSFGSLTVSDNGLYDPGTDSTFIGLTFATTGAGRLRMANGAVTVNGDASFGGGSTAGLLTGGALRLFGQFTQVSTNSDASFSASAGHETIIAEDVTPDYTFGTPGWGADSSHFGDLVLRLTEPGIQIGLQSDLVVEGQLRIDSTSASRAFIGSPSSRTLRAGGAEIYGGLTLNTVELVLLGTAPISALEGLTFINQTGGGPQLTVGGNTDTLTLQGPSFDAAASGDLLAVFDAEPGTVGGDLVVAVVTPSPAYHSARISELGAGLVSGWPADVQFVWTGEVSTDWHTPGNWSMDSVPLQTDSAVVPATATVRPTISSGGPVLLGSLNIQSDTLPVALLGDSTRLFLTGGGSIYGPVAHIAIYCDSTATEQGVWLSGTAAQHTLRGRFACNVFANSNITQAADSVIVDRRLSIYNQFRLGAPSYVRVAGEMLDVQGTGLVEMSASADRLDVRGLARFAGSGPSTMTAGLLRVGENFQQLAFNGNLRASGSHITEFYVGNALFDGTPYVTFDTPDTAGSYLNHIEFNANRKLASRLVTLGSVSVDGAVLVDSTGVLQVGTHLAGSPGANLGVDEVWVGGLFNFAGDISGVDSIRFTGSGQEILSHITGSPIQYPSLIIAGTATMRGVFDPIQGYINVRDGGELRFGSPDTVTSVPMTGDLSTFFGGTIRMTDTATTVAVGGSTSFSGGSTAGKLTEGVLEVMIQFGASDSGFVAGGNHRVVLNDPGGTPAIYVAGATEFNDLELTVGARDATFGLRTKNLYLGSGTLTTSNDSSFFVTGNLAGGPGATITVPGLHLGGANNFDGTYAIDTLVLNGTGQRLKARDPSGSAVAYNHIRVTGTAQTLIPHEDSLVVAGFVWVSGGGNLRFGEADSTGVIRLEGNLLVHDSATVEMLDDSTTVRVLGAAAFEGASTAGKLVAGELELHDWISQQSGFSAEAFAASPTHRTRMFASATPAQITFTTPGLGAGTSHFGAFRVVPALSGGIQLNSDVFVAGQFFANDENQTEIRSPETFFHRLHTSGANVDDVEFVRAGWTLLGTEAIATLDNIVFTQVPVDSVAWLVQRAGGSFGANGVSFGTVPTTGKYLVVEDTDGPADLIFDVLNATPAYHNGFVDTLGGAQLTSWTEFGGFVWTGNVDSEFGVAGNWDLGAVPGVKDSVYVPESTTNPLEINSVRRVGAISLATQSTNLFVNDSLIVTRSLDVVSSDVACTGAGRFVLDNPSGTSTLRAFAQSCEVGVRAGTTSLDTASTVDFIQISGTGVLDLNGKLLSVGANFSTSESGVLRMDDAADTLVVEGDAIFSGGSSNGLLTNGLLQVHGNFSSGGFVESSFAASGMHHTQFLRTAAPIDTLDLNLNSPDSARFAFLTVDSTSRKVTYQVRVDSLLRLAHSAKLVGGFTAVSGGLNTGEGTELAVTRLALLGQITDSGVFKPDTVDFLGTDFAGEQLIPAANFAEQHVYKYIRIFGDARFHMGGGSQYYVDSLIEVVNGGFAIGDLTEGSVTVNGGEATLLVSGVDARLLMDRNAAVNVRNAIFANGNTSETGLIDGDLIIAHDFSAADGAFRAGSGGPGEPTMRHRVVFSGDSGTVHFDNPLTGRFFDLAINAGSNKRLTSDVWVDGIASRETAGSGDPVVRADSTNVAPPRFLHILGGAQLGSGVNRIYFRNVAVVLSGDNDGGSSTPISFGEITFEAMQPTYTFLRIENVELYSGGAALSFDQMVFNTAATGTGKYFELVASDAELFFPSSTPSIGCMVTSCLNTTYEPQAPGLVTWTGVFDDNWNTSGNWFPNRVPDANTNVLIPFTGGTNPTLYASADVRDLTVEANAVLAFNGFELLTVRGDLEVSGGLTGADGLTLMRPIGIKTLRAPGTIEGKLQIGLGQGGVPGIAQLEDSVRVEGTAEVGGGVLRLNGHHFITQSSFTTSVTGRLEMSSATDSLVVADYAVFSGGSTAGLLTAGVLDVGGNFSQYGSANSFQAEIGHLTILRGLTNRDVTFTYPGVIDSSHFGSLEIVGTANPVNLYSNVNATGTLYTSGSTPVLQGISSPRKLRTTGGASSGITFDNVSWEIAEGGGTIGALSAITFQNMDSEVDQLTIRRSSGSLGISDLSFTPLAGPVGGRYIVLEDTDLGSDLTLTLSNVSPLGYETYIAMLGTAQIFGWNEFTHHEFTGAVNGDPLELGNWSQGVVPGAGDSVVVNNIGMSEPMMLVTPLTVRSFVTAPGAMIASNDTITVSHWLDLRGSTVMSCSPNSAYKVTATGNASVSSSAASCDLVLTSGIIVVTDSARFNNVRIRGTSQLQVNGGKLLVGDSLSTEDSGVLRMLGATDSVDVEGPTVFAGGSTDGWLTDGDLVLRGDLTVGGSTATAFTATGAHTTHFGDPAQSGGFRMMSFAHDTSSHFSHLVVYEGTTVVADILPAQRSLYLATVSSNLLQGPLVRVGFGLSGTDVGTIDAGDDGAVLDVERVTLFGDLTTTADFAVDTMDFMGTYTGSQAIPSQSPQGADIPYQLLRNFAHAAMSQGPGTEGYKIGVAIHVLAGQLSVGDDVNPVYVRADTADIIVLGDDAALAIAGSGAVVTVDSAHFQGGQFSSIQSDGTLRVLGDFVQRTQGVHEAAFLGSPDGTVVIAGSGVIDFENVGNSQFGNLTFEGGHITTLNSNVWVSGEFKRLNPNDGTVTVRSNLLTSGNNRHIRSFGGFNLPTGQDQLLLRNVRATIEGTNPGPTVEINNITWTDMDPEVVFLDIDLVDFNLTSNNLSFNSAVTTGRYVHFGDATSTDIAFVNAFPNPNCLNTTCNDGDTAPDGTFESATWQGDQNSLWSEPLNWDTGVVPSITTDVTITTGSPNSAGVGSDAVAHSMTVNSGATITIGAGNTVTLYGDLDVQGTVAAGSGLIRMSQGDSATLTASGTIGSDLQIAAGPFGQTGVVALGANVTLNGGPSMSLNVTGGRLNLNSKRLVTNAPFRTTGTGVLEMSSVDDTLEVNNEIEFSGGSTEGLLTAGGILLSGDFTQTSATSSSSFAATGAHSVSFTGTGNGVVSFATPDTLLSRFANVRFDKLFAAQVQVLSGSVVIEEISYWNSILSIDGSADTVLVRGQSQPTTNVNAPLLDIPLTSGIFRLLNQTCGSPIIGLPSDHISRAVDFGGSTCFNPIIL